jgi:hypothetical protein
MPPSSSAETFNYLLGNNIMPLFDVMLGVIASDIAVYILLGLRPDLIKFE